MPEDWMKSDNVNGIDPLKLQMLNSCLLYTSPSPRD